MQPGIKNLFQMDWWCSVTIGNVRNNVPPYLYLLSLPKFSAHWLDLPWDTGLGSISIERNSFSSIFFKSTLFKSVHYQEIQKNSLDPISLFRIPYLQQMLPWKPYMFTRAGMDLYLGVGVGF